MNGKKLLDNEQGLRKMRTLIEDRSIVMVASHLDRIPFSVCPATLQQLDEKGNLWFFASTDSCLFKDIGEDNRVQLLYSDRKGQKYLTIYGRAVQVPVEQKRDELWDFNLLKWFEGKDDPKLALLSVSPEHSYYWDDENNRTVSFFKRARAVIPKGKMPAWKKGLAGLWNH